MKRFCTLLIMMICMIQYANCQEKFPAVGKIDRELLEEINNGSRSDDLFRVIIVMSEQYDAVKMTRQTQFMDKTSKREFVIDEMKSFTKSSQSEVVNIINSVKSDNGVRNVRQHWAFNGISCEASADVIALLAERFDIKMIYFDEERNMLPEKWNPQPVAPTRGNAWNVEKVNADDVWNYYSTSGFTGNGVLVAVIDTGVNYNHTDIADNMWDGGVEYPHHGYDFINNDIDPIDDHGHGSHCAGTVAGNGTSGIQTGMAPGAKIMALKTLSAEGEGYDSDVVTAIEFAVENGANVISISLGSSGVGGCDYYRIVMETTQNAGVVASVAAGNDCNDLYEYPVPYNVNAPGNCPPPWLNPDQADVLSGGTSAVVCIGATNQADVKADFSSIGPVTWTEGLELGSYYDYPYTEGSATEIGLIRPDVSAPGVAITSLSGYDNTGYLTMQGTSMATPCVSGVIALMLEADNTLTPAKIDEILETTAVPCENQTSKNNRTGAGRIDALAAIDAVMAEIGLFPPSDFAATLVNGNDVQMSWTGVSGATSYKVYRDGVAIATLSTTSYTDASLSNGIYQYSVSAVYAEGESYKTASVEIQIGELCNIIFNLSDSYGDGWDGAVLTVSSDYNIPSADYTIGDGNSAQYTYVSLVGATITLTWNSGNFDNECSFSVENQDGDLIYTSIGNLSEGFITSFVSCSEEGSGCAIVFNLYDSYGDGWNGGATLTASFDDGTPDYSVAVPLSNSSAQYTYVVSADVMVTLTWTAGSFDSECSFSVEYQNGSVIYASEGTPTEGFITSFNSCEGAPVEEEYNINIEGGIQHGTVTAAESAHEGDEVTVTATPESGYYISSLYYYTTNPDNKTDIDTTTMKFIMPAADVTIGATFTDGVDINEVNDISASVYPNPIDDVLSITCGESIINISLFAIAGNVVFTETNIAGNSFVADVNDLTAGVYILRIETNQGMVYRKISKR